MGLALRPGARKGGDKKRKTGGVLREKEALFLSSVIFDDPERKKFIPFVFCSRWLYKNEQDRRSLWTARRSRILKRIQLHGRSKRHCSPSLPSHQFPQAGSECFAVALFLRIHHLLQ